MLIELTTKGYGDKLLINPLHIVYVRIVGTAQAGFDTVVQTTSNQFVIRENLADIQDKIKAVMA